MSDEIKKYFDLLVKWNSKINLISVSNFDEFVSKHVDDSKRLIPHLAGMTTILDLGSGAGVPGIIIKIEKPKLDVTLLDATRKKVSFCEEAIRTLNLKEILAVWGRAEDEGIMKGLGAFDCVISRATWDLRKYLIIAYRYVDHGGTCIAMKGSRWADELRDARESIDEGGLIHAKTDEYVLRDGEKRAILVFKRRERAETIV